MSSKIDQSEIARLLGLKPRSAQAAQATWFCEDVRKQTIRLRAERSAFNAKMGVYVARVHKAISALQEAAEDVGDRPMLLVHLPRLKAHLARVDRSRVKHRPPDPVGPSAIRALADLYVARTGRGASSTSDGPFAELVTLVLDIKDPARAIRAARGRLNAKARKEAKSRHEVG